MDEILVMVEKATFGAGCFWGVEESLHQMLGVVSTRVGYTGGSLKNPNYEDVCIGDSDHVEAVEVTFNNSVSSEKKTGLLMMAAQAFIKGSTSL